MKSKPVSEIQASQGVRQVVVERVGTTLENPAQRDSAVPRGAFPAGGLAKETPLYKAAESTIAGIAVAGIVLH